MEIICPRCNGSGLESDGITDCWRCEGSGVCHPTDYIEASKYRQIELGSVLSDLKDSVKDIKDKCDDIWEKLNK